MFCLNYHPFNEENMYVKGKSRKTKTYTNWLQNFPAEETIIYVNSLNIDWDKPIGIHLKYICKAGVGAQNFNRATIDMLLNLTREKGSGSVEQVIAEIVSTCKDYKDGKIYFYIKNC